MSRETLKKARKDAGMTQKQVAKYLSVGERHYKKIESGEIVGSIALWDRLEDLFKIHQRKLRELSTSYRDKVSNQ